MSSQTKIIGDYIIAKLIGRGSFSHVYGGYHKITKNKIAVKHITINSIKKDFLDKLLMEIEILKYINHPNIISMYDVVISERSIYIILEYCKGGELHKFIQTYKNNGIPESTVYHFMVQLREGLKIFNDIGIVHRDLKPQNILLSENTPKAKLKIADFGMARFMDPNDLSQTLCGTPLYMAPEILKKQPYKDNVDLWSIGVIMWEMVTGYVPYKSANFIELVYKLDNETLTFPENILVSDNCKDLLFNLLKVDPLSRINFYDFYNHNFFQQDDTSNIYSYNQNKNSFSSTASHSFGVNNPFGESFTTLKEDWIMINQKSDLNSQLLSDIKIGNTSNCHTTTIFNKMKAVAELGDKKVSEGQMREADSLYSYSLNTIVEYVNDPNYNQDITNFYNMYTTKRNSINIDGGDLDCDKLIFDEADAVSRKGVQKEMEENYNEAHDNYKRSINLFQSLLTYKNMSEDDKLRLNVKIDCLNERITKTLNMLKSYP